MDSYLFALLVFSCFCSFSKCTVVEPQPTIDEIILAAAESSKQMDFIQSDNTVLVELDMLFKKDQWEQMVRDGGLISQDKKRDIKLEEYLLKRDKTKKRVKRKAVYGNYWTNNVVPYVLSNVFSYYDRGQINAAFADYHKHTCIKFRPATSRDYNRILIQNGGGCSSFVGMSGGPQGVSLGSGCRIKGIVVHELGHAIGFHHEQTRPDRDRYVTIRRRNISPSMYYNFQQYSWKVIKNYGVPYDYLSVMHYGQYAFSVNRRPTIVAKDSRFQSRMGNRQGFSFRDVKLANLMYRCNSHCRNKDKKCPGEGFIGKDCKCWCPGNPWKHCGSGGGTGTETGTGGTGTGGTGTGGTGTGGNVCRDMHAHCVAWARMGYCTAAYRYYMEKNCKRSCGTCDTGGGTGTATCKDSNLNCIRWAARGECRRNPAYMLSYCKRSCNSCGAYGSPLGECRDYHGSCRWWANMGQCRRNPGYMNVNCARSCAACL